MKNLIFILSFAFTMFFTNTAFAASVDNSLVDEKVEVVSTETHKVPDAKDDGCWTMTIYVLYSDGSMLIITAHGCD